LRRDRLFVKWIMQSDRCRAVHFQEYTPWLAAAHCRKLRQSGLKLFFTVHGVYPNKYMSGVPKALFHRWWRDAWQQCDLLFVHTEGLGRALRNYLGSESPPIHVTPAGIPKMLGDVPRDPGSHRAANRKHLLFFGVVRPTKGLHILLEAMRDLPGYRLTVAGDFKEASYKRGILEQMAALPKDRVRLIDRFVDDEEVPALFSGNGLVILPYTFFYAQSGVLRLALKYGVPVVASDVGGLSETVQAWGVGECVPPGDAGALRESIRRMVEPRRHEAAMAAIEKIRQELTWQKTAELTWHAYRSVLARFSH
jgi:glycosyltransferase involved in cell wall biosynthesis